jgi:cytochrome bd-type quinol oxidase subunit 2
MYDAASCNNSHLIILVVALVWVIFTLLYFVSIYELFTVRFLKSILYF